MRVGATQRMSGAGWLSKASPRSVVCGRPSNSATSAGAGVGLPKISIIVIAATATKLGC